MKAPDDIRGLHYPCPTCGETALAGLMVPDGGWLQCSECRTCLPDTGAIREALFKRFPWTKKKR